MRHPNEMKNEGIGWHSNSAFPIRPSHKLVTLMLKDGGLEDTLLAVADRAGHHTVMAPDARGKTVKEGLKIFGHALKFLKGRIPLPCPF